MPIFFGFLIVLLAGMSQGSFYLPATYTRKWEWEHSWFVFAVSGMLVINWILGFVLLPNVFAVLRSMTAKELIVVLLFGGGWGIGAVGTGLGMDRLGMALAYPIILGLVACLGALIPMAVFFPETLLAAKGLVLMGGTALVVVGIVMISKAGARKAPSGSSAIKGSFAAGLVICIIAGVLSCLFNVGYASSARLAEQAKSLGAADMFASTAVWLPFLTVGCIVNAGGFAGPGFGRNLVLGSLMGLLWIGGVYLYSVGATLLGSWGVVVGWVLFMSSVILTGNLWGIFKGEWKGANAAARTLLNWGLAVLIVAIVIVAYSNTL